MRLPILLLKSYFSDVLFELFQRKLEEKIKDAVENQGESEVRQAWLEKAEFLCNIGNITEALEAFQTTYDKTVGTGNQLDVVFQMFRIGLYQLDHLMMKTKIDKAKELMEKGGDWERKNRLKVGQPVIFGRMSFH